MSSTNLFAIAKKNPQAAIKVFFFPFAGSSGSVFHQWAKQMHAKVEVSVLQLPGRGHKLDDDLYFEMNGLVDDLLPEVIDQLDRPYVFIGYSLGAKIAFELANRLGQIGFPAPLVFMPIASPAPHIPRAEDPIHTLPDTEFIERLRDYQGSSSEVLDDPEIMKLLIPGIRADFSILEQYEYSTAPQLNSKLSLFGGVDDEAVSLGDLQAWSEHFRELGQCKTYPGGHFFFDKSLRPLLDDINGLLEKEISFYGL